jgi:hypothetical protein
MSTCLYCSKEFEPMTLYQTCCSEVCIRQLRIEQRMARRKRCHVCRCHFAGRSGPFCSDECEGEAAAIYRRWLSDRASGLDAATRRELLRKARRASRVAGGSRVAPGNESLHLARPTATVGPTAATSAGG